MRRLIWFMMAILVLSVNVGAARGGTNMIEDGKTVGIDYTLTVNGEVVDTSQGKEPLVYIHGQGNIIKGLERQLTGLKVGDQKTILVSPDEGYGQINPNAFKEVPKTVLSGGEPQKGMMVRLQDQQGNVIPAIVADVKDETMILNFNHPLAGQELKFDIKVMSVK